jgi:hypothetical protein
MGYSFYEVGWLVPPHQQVETAALDRLYAIRAAAETARPQGIEPARRWFSARAEGF